MFSLASKIKLKPQNNGIFDAVLLQKEQGCEAELEDYTHFGKFPIRLRLHGSL